MDIKEIIICLLGILAVVGVGWAVLDNMSHDFKIAEEFCLDKKGIYNLSDYYNDVKVCEIVNCSSENPCGVFEAISCQ